MCHFLAGALGLDFGLFANGQIEAGADVSEEVMVLVIARDAVIGKPTILTISPAQPVFHRERQPSIERLFVSSQALRMVIGMDALGPALAYFLLERAAGKFQPGLVDEGAEFVRAGGPYQHRGGIGH